MPGFSLADAYIPAVWRDGLEEKSNAAVSLLNSAAVVKSPVFGELASGPSHLATLPFFRDISGQDDEVQVERTAPGIQGLGVGSQVAILLNRVTANDLTAEARDLGHKDPAGDFLGRIARRRLAQRQKTLLAILRGAFGSALAPNSLANFVETAAGAKFFSVDIFFDAMQRLGNLEQSLAGGAIVTHSKVLAGMKKADEIAYLRASDGSPFLPAYKGLPIYIDDSLVRTGTTSGFVYDTYLLAPGTIGWGEKPQEFNEPGAKEVVGVATFNVKCDSNLNVESLFDRRRELLHLDGLKWVGTDKAGKNTNADLALPANWALAYDTPAKVGAIRLQTNG